jgi:hypothetical protein
MSVQATPPLVLAMTPPTKFPPLTLENAPAAYTTLGLEGSTARVVSYQPWPPR